MSEVVSLMNVPLPSEMDVAQQKAWVTYTPVTQYAPTGDNEPCLRLHENRSVISGAGTTGLRTWEAALHLGSYLLSSPEASLLVQGKNVLELGAGTGFLSILCAKTLQANHVIATDGDEGVVDALKANVSFNNIVENVPRCSVLRWGHTLRSNFVEEESKIYPLDTVIGADVVSLSSTFIDASNSSPKTYDKAVIPALVSTIREVFEFWPRANVVIAATIRNSDTFSAFEKACGELDKKAECERLLIIW